MVNKLHINTFAYHPTLKVMETNSNELNNSEVHDMINPLYIRDEQ